MRLTFLNLLLIITLLISMEPETRAGEIHEAAQRGDTVEIAKLLKANPKLINAPDELHGCIPTKWQPLHVAIFSDHLATAKYLISKGADINGRGAMKDTPLHRAALKSNSEFTQMLLNAGAKVNVQDWRGDTPLHSAANWKIAALLLHKGADINPVDSAGYTPLRSAASERRMDVVKCLINKGAKVTIHDAAMISDVSRIQSILKAKPWLVNDRTKFRKTPLILALRFRHREAAEVLLAAGANVRAAAEDGDTPLHYAVAAGYKDMVTRLIDKGALINICKGSYWSSPLHAAVATGNKEIAELLLSRGAKSDIRRSGEFETPMHTAAELADEQMINILLSYGTDINIREFDDGSGDTPLHKSVRWNRVKMAEYLISKGADVNSIGSDGATPLHLAASWSPDHTTIGASYDENIIVPKHEGKDAVEMVSLLIASGADVNAVDAEGRNALALTESGAIAKLLTAKGVKAGSIFEAAIAGDVERLKSLVSADGGLFSKKDKMKREPIHYAAMGGSAAIMRLLLEDDPIIDTQDTWDMTPLHFAAREGNTEVLKLLLEKGAKPHLKDWLDMTPLQYAVRGGHKETADILRMHRAR